MSKLVAHHRRLTAIGGAAPGMAAIPGLVTVCRGGADE
jgi:hypothetical protein